MAGSFNNFPDGTKEVSQGDGEEEIVALAAAIVFVGDGRGRRRRFEIACVEVRVGETVWCLHTLVSVLIDALTPSKEIIRREFITNLSFEGDWRSVATAKKEDNRP